jgi:hypothetical protein
MANETITGCYDKETGEVVFTKSACSWKGCYVKSGIHSGQIQVEVVGGVCEDTYFACFDSETGNFEVTVPDNCECSCPCPFCENPPSPAIIFVEFNDVVACGDFCRDLPGIASRLSEFAIIGQGPDNIFEINWDHTCFWQDLSHIGFNETITTPMSGNSCSAPTGGSTVWDESQFNVTAFTVETSPGVYVRRFTVGVQIFIEGTPVVFFGGSQDVPIDGPGAGDSSIDCEGLELIIDNNWTSGDCGGSSSSNPTQGGYGGTATLTLGTETACSS